VVSASHNPYRDNGIKFFGPDGTKLADGEEERVEALLAAPAASRRPAPGRGRAGRLARGGPGPHLRASPSRLRIGAFG
jgi:phosphoglucosamine mutase